MTEPILFLPGLLCDARVFLPQIVHLGARHPLHIAVPARGETVEQMSEAILATAPPKFILIGHGLGGDIALDILRRDLGRDQGRASRAVLISTDPLAEPPATAAARGADRCGQGRTVEGGGDAGISRNCFRPQRLAG